MKQGLASKLQAPEGAVRQLTGGCICEMTKRKKRWKSKDRKKKSTHIADADEDVRKWAEQVATHEAAGLLKRGLGTNPADIQAVSFSYRIC